MAEKIITDSEEVEIANGNKDHEFVLPSKQNLKGTKKGQLPLRRRNGGKENEVLESSMLTKLAERRRRSEAMSASDWEETLQRFEMFFETANLKYLINV